MFTERRRDNLVALNPERKKELQLFEKHARIRFRKLEFLNQAFTHRSFAHEAAESGENNERLEFLGDSVLGLVVAEYVYATLPEQPEGELARIKSFVVSEASLSEIARGLRVDNFILIGKGEEYSGGRSKKTILADCLEAIIGAYYLDSGFPAAEGFVHTMLIPGNQQGPREQACQGLQDDAPGVGAEAHEDLPQVQGCAEDRAGSRQDLLDRGSCR